jgi:hypothetical protein
VSDFIVLATEKAPKRGSEQASRIVLHDAHRGVVQARQELSYSLEQLSQVGERTASMVSRRGRPVLIVAGVLGCLFIVALVVRRPPALLLGQPAARNPSLSSPTAVRAASLLRGALSTLAVAVGRRLLSRLLSRGPGGPLSR